MQNFTSITFVIDNKITLKHSNEHIVLNFYSYYIIILIYYISITL